MKVSLAPLCGVVFLAAACVTVPLEPGDASRAASAPATTGFSFVTDTFAFPNEIRARNPDRPDLYANYCFVLARGVRQFFQFARFDPLARRLDHDGYARLVRRLAAKAPWDPALPPGERIVIPGYANLYRFSRAEEAAVKEGLGPRFWTLVHWTNWRVTLAVSDEHQEQVASEIVTDLGRGRLVQLLVTNWPKPELNHTVVAVESRGTPGTLEVVVWDPNDPANPGVITFDRARRRFWASRVYDTEPGEIRVFRMYYSPWL
ncbi:MAG: hypothetical protein HY727_06130 [Candidatus Rokubacteria bacterium]|nr:hypothetical protein [Candidatus Rokubacteria bacterium]